MVTDDRENVVVRCTRRLPPLSIVMPPPQPEVHDQIEQDHNATENQLQFSGESFRIYDRYEISFDETAGISRRTTEFPQ